MAEARTTESAPEAAWQRVCDELLVGIHHALNNRVGALSAVAQVLELELREGHPLRSVLAEEVERLRRAVGALTLLPRREEGAEPLLLADLLPGLVELYDFHHGVRDTPCGVEPLPPLPPVCAEPGALSRLLLTLMIAIGEAARAAGGEVGVRCEAEGEWVEVRIWARGGAAASPVVDVAALRPRAVALGGELGAVSGPGEGPAFRLRLPTLAEVRRREREGSG